MKHAILVMGYGNDAAVLQATINHLDDPQIDFYIHWDQRYPLSQLKSSYSKIIFIKERQAVYWGTYSQIKAEYCLIKNVANSDLNYDYLHLISSHDIPLMQKEYFKNYFTAPLYLGFVPSSEVDLTRISYYYPLIFKNFRSFSGRAYLKGVRFINRLFGINRLNKLPNDIKIEKGTNWFSVNAKLIPTILNFPYLSLFQHSYCADELYLQTILSQFKPQDNLLTDNNEMAARYIDWQRGKPYTFTSKDILELRDVINTKYAFARKVNNPQIIEELFKND